jgi:GIY-YIG catalytic domain
MDRTRGVYAIRCMTTGQVYIGASEHVGGRVGQHFSLLRAGRHPNRLLQRAWAVHGESAFNVEVLQTVEAEVLLADVEAAWVHRLRSREASSGFNIAPVPGDSMAAAEGTHRVRFNERAASMSAVGRSMDEALGIPREAVLRQMLAGLAAAGFGDVRPANFTVFEHMPPEGIRLTALADAALMTVIARRKLPGFPPCSEAASLFRASAPAPCSARAGAGQNQHEDAGWVSRSAERGAPIA